MPSKRLFYASQKVYILEKETEGLIIYASYNPEMREPAYVIKYRDPLTHKKIADIFLQSEIDKPLQIPLDFFEKAIDNKPAH